MNKIIIDKDYDLVIDNNNYYSIDIINNSNITITIKENINANMDILVRDSNTCINVYLNNYSKLDVYQLSINSSINLNIELHDNSYINYINSILSNNDSINNININHLENSYSNIYFNGVNMSNNKLYVTMNGSIGKNSINSKLNEVSKIYNIMDGDSKIIPNLLIDNHDIVANHSAYIGKFKDSDINYLKSRGLDIKIINKLLIKACLLTGIDKSIDRFNKIIDEFGGDICE